MDRQRRGKVKPRAAPTGAVQVELDGVQCSSARLAQLKRACEAPSAAAQVNELKKRATGQHQKEYVNRVSLSLNLLSEVEDSKRKCASILWILLCSGASTGAQKRVDAQAGAAHNVGEGLGLHH